MQRIFIREFLDRPYFSSLNSRLEGWKRRSENKDAKRINEYRMKFEENEEQTQMLKKKPEKEGTHI